MLKNEQKKIRKKMCGIYGHSMVARLNACLLPPLVSSVVIELVTYESISRSEPVKFIEWLVSELKWLGSEWIGSEFDVRLSREVI